MTARTEARWKSASVDPLTDDIAVEPDCSAIYEAMTELRANPNPRRLRYLGERLAELSGEVPS